MKSQPHLLVRDALAELFTQAVAGDAGALRAVAALERWRERPQGDPDLAALRTERDTPLFDAAGALTPDYEPLAAYVQDRALRFAAACRWLGDEGALGDVLAAAAAAWDAGLFFEVHELLEPLWLRAEGPRRTALQGLIMAGAALHHLCDGNRTGARSLLREASRKLEASPGALEVPWDLLAFARGLDVLATGVDSGRIATVADIEDLPALA